jgi:glycosyltransferase involved in cell wall biosynthesis
MRIALVSVSSQLGGSEAVLVQLIAQLHRLRPAWSLHLVVPGEGPLVSRARNCGAEVHIVPMPVSIARIGEWGGGGRGLGVVSQIAGALGELPEYQRRFAAAIAAIDPDILHTNGFKAHVLAARLDTQAVRVWHIHEYVSRRPVTRRLLRRYGAIPQAIVANSLSVATDVTGVINERLRRPVRVIHNGVDLSRFRPDGPVADLDAACGLPPVAAGTIRVGLVATFARWKGHDTFLRAVAALHPDVKVRPYIIGGALYDTAGSQWSLDELRARARALGVETRVGFTGFQAGMPACLRALDVVVHASTEPEPFGLVIAEAMAAGRAVTTSGVGGAAEIVEPDTTAVLHAAGNPASLAGVIERLARDAALRARLGAAARTSVMSRFDAGRFGEAFVNLYETMR